MNCQKTTLKKTIVATALALCLGGASATFAGEKSDYSDGLKDAWLDGKIETAFALNQYLNPFAIDTTVENGVAYLEGSVESDIDRDLAGQIALSVEGVSKVENDLVIAETVESEGNETSNDFLQAVNDATTTAMVKTKLLANGNTSGLKINVDTHHSTVTLRGTVESDQVRDLAEALAQNTDNVKSVENELEIMNQ